MQREPRLTLAVIVKNEAKLLSGLLHHHRELYDEAVVVDTGSIDKSPTVALEAGAKVWNFPWIDDFAAARNYGLKQANCPWVLQMDCDERISPADFSSLRKIVEQNAQRCFELPINNYAAKPQGGEWSEVAPADLEFANGAPGFMRTHPVRLFPNMAGLRFHGVIHENLLPDIQSLGLAIERGNQVIHHTGLLESQGLKRREILYTRLLEKKVSLFPHDLHGLTEYAKVLASSGQLLEAEQILSKGLAKEKAVGQHAVANLFMVEIHARQGKVQEALERLKPTIHQHPNHLLCWVQAAALYFSNGQGDIARIYLAQGRKLFPKSAVLKQLEAKV